MKVLWICGLPDEARRKAVGREISSVKTAAWSWVLGHLPPPEDVELHIACPVRGLVRARVDFIWQGAHWHCFRQRRFEQALLWLRMYLQIASFVRALKPDVVHGWGGETGCGWLATLLTDKAVVSVQGLLRMLDRQMEKFEETSHWGMSGAITRFLERRTYLKAKQLLVESETSQLELKRFYNCASRVVHHPLRKSFLLRRAPMSEIHDRCRLLYIGELVSRKGARDFVDALRLCGMRDMDVVMVGQGPLQQSIVELLRKYALCNQVKMLPSCSGDEIMELMASSDLFVLPSYGDTGPTVLKEAISQGLYPICYDNTGPHELISKYCGRLSPTGDVLALANAILEESSRLSLCRAEALSASTRIKSDLSADAAWFELLRIYRRATS